MIDMATAKYQRWVSLGYIGAAMLAYMLVGNIADIVWNLMRMPSPKGWSFSPPELFGAAAAILCFLILRRRAEVNVFMNEAAAELAKVTYPPRKETAMSTGVILTMVGICAVILAVFDVCWGWAVKILY
jgi:preprotein translocase SecE subunit